MQPSRRSNWRATLLRTVLLAALSVTASGLARAENLFDLLFGGFLQHPAPQQQQYPPPPASGIGRVAPPALGQESVTDAAGTTGHSVGFCVRLCDGQHFPIEQIVNGTPAETCRAICPYSRTKVFFGSEIGGAVASDGQRYASLDTAFLYRKQLVAKCTCNGRDALGLVSFDVKNDPTLRPGDIISTKEGLLAYTGRSGQTATFTSVDPATLPPDIKPSSSQSPPSPSTAPIVGPAGQPVSHP